MLTTFPSFIECKPFFQATYEVSHSARFHRMLATLQSHTGYKSRCQYVKCNHSAELLKMSTTLLSYVRIWTTLPTCFDWYLVQILGQSRYNCSKGPIWWSDTAVMTAENAPNEPYLGRNIHTTVYTNIYHINTRRHPRHIHTTVDTNIYYTNISRHPMLSVL
jgi:hypothetical protein